MLAALVQKELDYVLNHCAKYLARDNADERHSFFGLDAGQARAPDQRALAPPNRRCRDDSGVAGRIGMEPRHLHLSRARRSSGHPRSIALPCSGLNAPAALASRSRTAFTWPLPCVFPRDVGTAIGLS